MTQDFKIKLACSAGVLLVRANVKSSQSFIRPAMFDLELEWTVGFGAGEEWEDACSKGKAKHPMIPLITCASRNGVLQNDNDFGQA